MTDAGIITGAALMFMISQCGGPQPPTDLLFRIIMHESGGRVAATNVNKNGSTDYGLAQINSSNLAWLGETPRTILDPCRNIAAEARILRSFSAYATGSQDRGFVLRPPGKTVSYAEDMADPRYRDRSSGAVATAPPRKRRHQLISFSTK